VFSVGFVPRGYKGIIRSLEKDRRVVVVERSEEPSFGTPACQGMSSGAEELNGVESSELAVAE
jgi:hypothetical protein